MPEALVITAKAITYAATLGAAGGIFFVAYSHALLGATAGARIRRHIGVLLVVAALASAVKILATAASASGDLRGMFDPGLVRMILQGGEGRASVVRATGLLLMTAALTARGPPGKTALVGAVAAATSFAWIGHPHAAADDRLATGAVVVHLLAAAFWLGALAPLLIVTRDADRARIAATVLRFGAAALIVVAILLVAGVCLLCLLLNDAGELWTTRYGHLVCAKLVFVGCLLALAAYNRKRLTPRLGAQARGAEQGLRRSIQLEIVAAAAVLIFTAALTTLTGPGDS
jgi:putative copper resistance protein D